MQTQYIQVVTTINSKDAADKLAFDIAEMRLAACVQVEGPIKSTYWWKGKLETDEEYRCVFKTKGWLYDLLEASIKKLHTYDTPEILVFQIIQGNSQYFEWMDQELD
ncbi:MAG: divalent-cation tolerance protein CutA [Deltaproteobacteria bacterium]|nr:divalent-cation tolerance protein CutA [Deltaproteobacteria bacterium]